MLQIYISKALFLEKNLPQNTFPDLILFVPRTSKCTALKTLNAFFSKLRNLTSAVYTYMASYVTRYGERGFEITEEKFEISIN